MNPGFAALEPYPFQRLTALLKGVQPAQQPRIALTIGEPQHAPPDHVVSALAGALTGVARYPTTIGSEALRTAIAEWLQGRFDLQFVDPARQVLPVNGTREALFAIAQALVTPGEPGRVISPNPFYQIYEGAALLAGTTPRFVAAQAETGFVPQYNLLSEDDWQQAEVLYLCNPGNPSGAVMSLEALQNLIKTARAHNVIVISDECYSEIYRDEENPPPGLLTAAASLGYPDFNGCLVFHSLSKRSNLPGLRSGFVAGDADLISQFTRYRTYHGCAMPPHHQVASTVAWRDEEHVRNNRRLYRAKFAAVIPLLKPHLELPEPDAGFYLWPAVPGDDAVFARRLIERCNVAVLPGQYLGREVNGCNPGAGRIRMALVAELDHCITAAQRMAMALEEGL